MKLKVILSLILALAIGAAAVAGQSRSGPLRSWWTAGSGERFATLSTYENANGAVALLNAGGAFETKGHPFFEPLGPNGRACVTCHQPSSGMSLSSEGIRERWTATQGRDPLFAAVDGANCPSLPQAPASSHSLLLDRGLIRVALPWPPIAADGSTIVPEFTIEIVRDPSTCNTDPTYGIRSATPRVSVFRRPRVTANLKYVASGSPPFNIKTGELMDIDPETRQPVGMNLMSDAREPTLRTQARRAARDHLQLARPLAEEELSKI